MISNVTKWQDNIIINPASYSRCYICTLSFGIETSGHDVPVSIQLFMFN